MRKFLIFLLISTLFAGCSLFKQNGKKYTTNSNRAVNKYEDATQAFDNYDYAATREKLNKSLEIDPEFVEAWLLKGQLHLEKGEDSLAQVAYEEVIRINPDFFPHTLFNLAKLYLMDGRYKEALQKFKRYKNEYANRPIQVGRTNKFINQCKFAIEQKANPVGFDPKNLGSNINSSFDEYINSMSVDESHVIFTVKKPIDGQEGSKEIEDFYYADKNKKTGEWKPRRKMGTHFNTPGNEGAMFISPDQSFLVFAACNRPDGFGSCDLYISQRQGEQWGEPKNMGKKVNSRKWDSHPTIGSDSKTIYFVSTRVGGKGKSDIWVTRHKPDGSWTFPENLGKKVNSKEDEYYPFIHPDNNTLYFSSGGHLGMGGLDFFMTRKQEDGKWSEPANLGYPINTHRDELGLQVNASGRIAFLSTDRLKGEGRFDIYSFELYDKVRPTPVTYMKGVVFDKNTKEKLKARFELTDLETGEVVATAYSGYRSGEFLLAIPTNRNYALNVKKEGYLFYSDHFELKGVHEKADPYRKNVPLKPIQVGETVELQNIFFEFDKYRLLPESKVELDKLVKMLKNNPEMKIRLQGHTDNQGTEEYNMELSENRAKSVHDYLVENGIAKDRLSYKGFGESKPIATNETEEGRAKNRRTEFEVIEK